MKIISFPLSLRMMTQVLEALSSSERAGTSRSHLIELWRPLIRVYKTTWHTPQLPLSHTQSHLCSQPLWFNHFEKQRQDFHFSILLLFKMQFLEEGQNMKIRLSSVEGSIVRAGHSVFKPGWFSPDGLEAGFVLRIMEFLRLEKTPMISKSKH